MEHHPFFQRDRGRPSSMANLSPESPDSITMPGHSSPADVDMQSFVHHTSLPTQYLGAVDPMAHDLLGLSPPSHGLQHAVMQNLGWQPLMMNKFIQDQADPWTVLNIQSGHANPPNRQAPASLLNRALTHYRDFRSAHPPPSEADTISHSLAGILSDSGYGSMSKQSVGNPSVYSGDLEQSSDMIARFQAMGQDTISWNEQPRQLEARGHGSAAGPARPRSLRCPDCDAEVKTRSELNKHQARHKKPFKCPILGCLKATEGFSTNNDLDRHKRCVHKLHTGDRTVYRCSVGQCRDKIKDWPRQDNFRQHLRRKHNLNKVDLGPYTFCYSSSEDDSTSGSTEVGASEDTLNTNMDATSHASWMDLNRPHTATSSLAHGESRWPQTGNMMPYQDDYVIQGAGLGAVAMQQLGQSTQMALEMEPGLGGLRLPPSLHQEVSVPVTQPHMEVDRPTYIGSGALDDACMEDRPFASLHVGSPAQPVGMAGLDVDGAPEASDDDDQSEQDDETESGESDEMDEDYTAQGSHQDFEGAGVEDDDHDAGAHEPSGVTADHQAEDEEPFDSNESMDSTEPMDSTGLLGSTEPLDTTESSDGTTATQSRHSPPIQARQSASDRQAEQASPHIQTEHVTSDVPTEHTAAGIPTEQIVLDNPAQHVTPQYCRGDEVHIQSLQLASPSDTGKPQLIDADDDESQTNIILQSLIDKGKLKDVLEKLGYPMAGKADTKDSSPPSGSSVASDKSRPNKCDLCPKSFSRRCELRKHKKRHEKPYACTFPKCKMKFGSKNDWKRHENSQHVQLEIWRCPEMAATEGDADPPQPCGRVCHSFKSLRSHLCRGHDIVDPAVLHKKLTDCRMGRNFEARFWCGFCRETIDPGESGNNPSHNERFDHIDKHFSGRGCPKRDISEWKHVEVDPGESPEPSPVMKNKRLWIPVDPAADSRKRARLEDGGSGAAKPKRLKDDSSSGSGEKVLYWTCCSCKTNYWKARLTRICMDVNGCDHMRCVDCVVFEDGNNPELEVPIEAQAQEQDTVMMT